MNGLITGSRILLLLAIVFLGSISTAQSQDIFREMDDLKKDLSDLKNEVHELRNQVFALRKAVMEPKTPAAPQTVEKAPPQEEQATKPEVTISDAQLTKIICKAIGIFFSETEAVMRTSDPDAAESGMREALRKLNSTLHDYSGTHRVTKLLNIYEGLSTDAYVAVELRRSVAGNEEFIRTLSKHKQKYLKTCPRD